MTTKQLLAIVNDRKLRIYIKDGQPIIDRSKNKEALTDKLLAVLKRHREQIVDQLTAEFRRRAT